MQKREFFGIQRNKKQGISKGCFSFLFHRILFTTRGKVVQELKRGRERDRERERKKERGEGEQKRETSLSLLFFSPAAVGELAPRQARREPDAVGPPADPLHQQPVEVGRLHDNRSRGRGRRIASFFSLFCGSCSGSSGSSGGSSGSRGGRGRDQRARNHFDPPQRPPGGLLPVERPDDLEAAVPEQRGVPWGVEQPAEPLRESFFCLCG